VKTQYIGAWLITELEVRDADYINLVVPGYVTIGWKSSGFMQFGAVEADLDWHVEDIGSQQRLQFTFQGFDVEG
jgi:hypothetical protein